MSHTVEREQGALRFLHTMMRVRDLEKSILFYTTHFGMELLRRKDYPEGRFTLAFLGFGPEDTYTALELTYNWDQESPYEVGTGFGHIAFGVSDIYGVCEALAESGVKITRAPGPMKHGTTVIAFVEDPDGYKIELIER